MKRKNKYINLLKNNQIISNDSVCPHNYKFCGIFDTLNQKFCIPSDDICPINFIKIINENLNVDNYNFSIKKESFEDGFFLYYSNDNYYNSKILTLFKINENEINDTNIFPCINTTEKNWEYDYPLEQDSKRCITEYKGKKTDLRYEIIDNEIKYDFYKYNKIPVDLYNYNIKGLKEKNITLYARNILGFDINKINDIKFSYDNIISNKKSLDKTILIAGILILIDFILAVIFLIALCLIRRCKLEIIIERDIKYKIGIIIIIILFMCFDFTIFFCIYFLIKIKNEFDINISDEISNYFINAIKEEFQTPYNLSIAIIIINLIIIIIVIIIIVMSFLDGKKCICKKKVDNSLENQIIN